MAFVLKIAGRTVVPPQAGGPRVVLQTFSRSYEQPAELAFTVQGSWRSPPFGADQVVLLYHDNVLIFAGLTDLPRPSLRSTGPEIKYVAYDRGRAAAMRPVSDDYSKMDIPLPAGPLNAAVAKYLPIVSAALAKLGISATVDYFGAADVLECGIVSVTESIDAALRQVATAAHGCKVLMWSDGNNHRYRLVNSMTSPIADIVLDVDRLEEWDITQSLEGRAGAVAIMPESKWGKVEVTSTCELTPAWNAKLEQKWALPYAYSSTAEDGSEDDMSAVFRRWSFASGAGTIARDAELTAVVEGRLLIPPRRKVVPIVKVDWDAQTVLLREPAISQLVYGVAARNNPMIPGKSQRADARLRYSFSGSVPTYTPLARVPEAGFAGPVFQAAPITCANELRLTAPSGVNHTKYAQQAFDVFSKPAVSGNVTLLGELPADLWWLDRRINFRTASAGETGYEHLEAPLLGFKYAFDRGGKTTLDFNTDRREMMEGKPL